MPISIDDMVRIALSRALSLEAHSCLDGLSERLTDHLKDMAPDPSRVSVGVSFIKPMHLLALSVSFPGISPFMFYFRWEAHDRSLEAEFFSRK